MIHFEYKKSRRVVSTVVQKEEYTKTFLKVDMGTVTTKDMVEAEVDPTLVSIVEKLVMCQGFVPNCAFFVHTSTVPSMSPKIVLAY
jgi:hypothetical protein